MDIKKRYKWLTLSNSITVILALFIVLIVVSPGVKATVIKGLMKVGLFSPDVPSSVIETAGKKFPAAPNVVFYNTHDSALNLAALKGKVVFINFWATWCAPCVAEMPGINALYNKLSNDSTIVFLITDADGDFTKSGKFMISHEYNFPLFKTGDVPSTIFSNTLPTTVVINKRGEIVFRATHVANYGAKKFEDYLKQLAAE